MIISFIVNTIVGVLASPFLLIPAVTRLPLGIDSVLVNLFGYWQAFLVDFPYFKEVWLCAQWYLGLYVTLMVLKLFLGSHSPRL